MSDREVLHMLTANEVVKYIKRAPSGVSFCLHVGIDMSVPGTGQHYPNGFSGYLNLSRRDALRLFSQGIGSKVLEEKGARIRVTERTRRSNSLNRKTGEWKEKDVTVVWFGG